MAYLKQTWDTTSIFNPTRMNHIEEGIYDASINRVKYTTLQGTTTSSGAFAIPNALKGKPLIDIYSSNTGIPLIGLQRDADYIVVYNPQLVPQGSTTVSLICWYIDV